MRYTDIQNVTEGMSFHAYKKDPEKGYFRMVTGDESQFQDIVYTNDFDRSGKDAYDYINPKYKEEHDLHLSNMSAYDVFDVIGYDADSGSVPIDEFIAKTTQWLQQNIGKPSQEQPATQDGNIISGGRPAGYYNRVIKQINSIARDGKAMGATHVGMNWSNPLYS